MIMKTELKRHWYTKSSSFIRITCFDNHQDSFSLSRYETTLDTCSLTFYPSRVLWDRLLRSLSNRLWVGMSVLFNWNPFYFIIPFGGLINRLGSSCCPSLSFFCGFKDLN
ncbi:hypothetical protein BC941DRAFT_515795 [Chlamydoabsidia padenii]|nr:hypothetical protein BC941DRAFT_515795 [Chlamydoabsidia padenii]